MEIIILFSGSSIFNPTSLYGYGYIPVWLLLDTGQCDPNMENEKMYLRNMLSSKA